MSKLAVCPAAQKRLTLSEHLDCDVTTLFVVVETVDSVAGLQTPEGAAVMPAKSIGSVIFNAGDKMEAYRLDS